MCWVRFGDRQDVGMECEGRGGVGECEVGV